MLFHNFFLNQWYKKANLIWVCMPLSLLNYIIFYTRLFLYKFNILNQKKLSVKTLVIGNLIIGGSGNTACYALSKTICKTKYQSRDNFKRLQG